MKIDDRHDLMVLKHALESYRAPLTKNDIARQIADKLLRRVENLLRMSVK